MPVVDTVNADFISTSFLAAYAYSNLFIISTEHHFQYLLGYQASLLITLVGVVKMLGAKSNTDTRIFNPLLYRLSYQAKTLNYR